MNTIPWLIVDGYNLMHRHGALPDWMPGDLEGRRRGLIVMLEQALGSMAERITLVFDGRLESGHPAHSGEAIEVLFSSGGQTADTLIERLVADTERPGDIVVVTSDTAERRTVEASGADSMSCSTFLDRWRAQDLEVRRTLKTRSDPARFQMGMVFPSPAPTRKGRPE